MINLFIFALLILIIISITLGVLKFDEKKKKYIMVGCSILYNFIFGILDPFVLSALTLIYAGSKMSDVIEVIVVYFVALVPMNIFYKKKSKISTKKYLGLTILATIAGIATLFVISMLGVRILRWI